MKHSKSINSAKMKPRIIIMRHSERLDSALGNNVWPQDVFINGVYTPNLTQMPTYLPLRADPQEYSLDTPLSRHGKAHARHTGRFFASLGLIPHRVYVSPAQRCVETADCVLEGLGLGHRIPLKVDLALHEPTKLSLPIQPIEYFSSEGFLIDHNYRPTLSPAMSEVIVGESRQAYYQRMYRVLKRATTKLIEQSRRSSPAGQPPTVLVVAHRSSVPLLGAMLNLDQVDDKVGYLNEVQQNTIEEVNFLSMIIAEYDASTGYWIFLPEFPQMPKKHAPRGKFYPGRKSRHWR